jgi:hypothetical protein
MIRIPSLKTLRLIKAIDESQVRELRDLLTGKTDPHEFVGKWIDSFKYPHYPIPIHEQIMAAANKIMMGNDVEYISPGHNQKSLAIYYVNLGDTYATTLMRINGRYVVGSWGNIVEKGSYD